MPQEKVRLYLSAQRSQVESDFYRPPEKIQIYQAAVASAAKNLAQELDIDLDNYDIT